MSGDNRRVRVFVKRVVNPFTRGLARSSRGPFALLRHVGRRSGKAYETPIMVWRVADGFVIELTYGPRVDWLRNLQAAGGGSLLWHMREYTFQRPEPIAEQAAMPALPPFVRLVLRLAGRHEYVLLRDAA